MPVFFIFDHRNMAELITGWFPRLIIIKTVFVDASCNYPPSKWKIHPFDPIDSKKMTATSLQVIVPFPEMGPYEVLVLNQRVTCQSHPRSAREQTSDVGPKLEQSYRWVSMEANEKNLSLKQTHSNMF